jgi:hypothetical protein
MSRCVCFLAKGVIQMGDHFWIVLTAGLLGLAKAIFGKKRKKTVIVVVVVS